MPTNGPDRDAALAQYRRRARVYDLELALFEPIRQRAIAKLAPRRGDIVLDVGCGTGLSFAALQARVGPEGRIVGIEQSPEMIARARERAQRNGWNNVTLLNAPVGQARVQVKADAALFHFTHDILREPRALAYVVRHLKPGAPVVASGLVWARRWAVGVNLAVLAAALRSVSTLEGLQEPWDHLAGLLGGVQVDRAMAGGVFVARGTVPPPRRRARVAPRTVPRR